MKPKRIGCPILLLVLGGALRAQPGTSVFPMEKGTTWTYAGSVAWQGTGQKVHRARMSWKTEVLDSAERGRFRIALLLGHPSDLTWYDVGTKRGCYVFTSVEERQFYLRKLESECVLPQGGLEGFTAPEDLVFRLPARKGDLFGGDPERQKEIGDGRYAWRVEAVRQVHLSGVAGYPADREVTAYDLACRTNPDDQLATYVPGAGLTAWAYSHHGSVSEVDMKLVEFRRGAPRR